MSDFEIKYKELEPQLIASVRLPMNDKSEGQRILDEIRSELADMICGNPFLIVHWDTVVDAVYDGEAGFPVKESFEHEKFICREVPFEKLIYVNASEKDLNIGVSALYSCLIDHGLATALYYREILRGDGSVEIQLPIHDWAGIFAENVEKVLGEDVLLEIMSGYEAVNWKTPKDIRFDWLKGAMEKLKAIASEEQCFDIVSKCAHIFPDPTIEKFRIVFRKEGTVEAVLKAMKDDPFFPPKPEREGNVLYFEKVPANRKAWEEASNPEEKRRAYCHCPAVRDRLEDIDAVFCYCGSGWFRRLWEGILEQPVRVSVVKCLPAGDEVCRFAVQIPSELT